ncbi:Hypothetical predicted protein [Paramuricea clavata]|uniref:Uncharacterized protein n=1 Tax=Paramuricea clavata TaxID=317549 RepID=A0A6S7FP15_PARCT|nr:Hypothetical predicted protein [Paramuricea clavata]
MRWQCIFTALAQVFRGLKIHFSPWAIQLACPGAKLPTRKQLADDGAGGLLDECYQKVKEEVNKVLSTDGQFVCLTSDAWSNVANDPVVNYMAVSPTKSLFLEADVSGGGPAEYPAGYPFEDLLHFAIDCKDVVSFFHNQHVPKAKLKKALAAAKLSGLVQPVPTR